MASVVTAVADVRPPVGFVPVGFVPVGFVPVGFDADGLGVGAALGVSVGEDPATVGVGGELSGADCSPALGSVVPDGAVSVHPTRAAASTPASTHRPAIIGT
jgi:hypothetical protein